MPGYGEPQANPSSNTGSDACQRRAQVDDLRGAINGEAAAPEVMTATGHTPHRVRSRTGRRADFESLPNRQTLQSG